MKEKVCDFYKSFEDLKPLKLIISDISRVDLNMDNREAAVSIAKINITKGDKNKDCGKMILKTPLYDDENIKEFPEFSPENIFKKYQKLKTKGFPVVPTLRYCPENSCFLMTDLTEGNKNIIIDKHKKIRSTGILIENMEQIKEEIIDIANRAWNCEIFLSFDAYSVVVNRESNIGKVYILDIGQMSYEIQHKDCLINNTQENAQDNAKSFLKHFLTY